MLYKRAGSKYWWVKLKSQGRTYYKSTGTTNKRKAQGIERSIKEQLWAHKHDAPKTFGDAAIRWIEEKGHKRSMETDLMILDWFRPRLETAFLSDINGDVIRKVRDEKKAEGRTASTVNRYMALLRSILNASEDWEWIRKAPKVPMYSIPKGEPRYLSYAEWLLLEKELPRHLASPAWLAVLTGLRAAPIRQLRWEWISRDGIRFPPGVMKNKKWLAIPLSLNAWHVLAENYSEKRERVFVNNVGAPWGDKFTTRAWRKASERAGLPGVRFHDLRHTWASWHAQNGTPMEVIQKLGGWSTYEAMQIYAHHSPISLQEWAANGLQKG